MERAMGGMRLIDQFDRGADRFPDRAFLVDGAVRRSYAEVREASHRIAAALLRCGGRPGDRAAVLSANSATAFECVVGILRAGLIWVPLNPFNTADDHRQLIDQAGVRILFLQQELRGIAAALHDSCRDLRLLVAFDTLEMEEFAGRDEGPVDMERASDDIATMFSTGGTTGRAKLVCVSNRAWETMALSAQALVPANDPVHLVAAPMTNAAGGQALAYAPMGMTNVMLPRFDPQMVIDAISEHRATHLFLPPTAIYRLLSHPGAEQGDYRSLRYFTYASAPMAVDRLKQAVALFGPVMTSSYGQTETGLNAVYLPPEAVAAAVAEGDDGRLASVGRAGPAFRMAIFDDEGAPVAVGEPGEVVFRGNQIFSHYFEDPAATAASRPDGWHHTGDIGMLDAQGYLTLLDRRDDMILSGGFNVYPAKVEAVLLTHPAVQDCAVFGMRDPDWGQRVTAAVELRAGHQVAEQALLQWARGRLSGVNAPKQIVISAHLPRSPAGKVLRREARAQLMKSDGVVE